MRKRRDTRDIESYDHRGSKRVNNPPVGLVTPDTDADDGKKTYQYDPHLDPQLVWAGKAERTSFDVPTVSLHVHERVDPKAIIRSVRKKATRKSVNPLLPLFETPEENRPLREAIEFYKHSHNWTNRLIAGDSLVVMNSLIEKEGMAGKVQMVFLDPPYGIRFGSNFQPFVNRRDVQDGKDDHLTQEPEMIRAFRDTWELGIHSYLTYLRDRLLLARELLCESGSCIVQIGDENLHLVRNILDEVFGPGNLVSVVTFSKTSGATSDLLGGVVDYLLLYAKDKTRLKYRQLFHRKELGGDGTSAYSRVELPDGRRFTVSEATRRGESLHGARHFRLDNLTSQRPPGSFPVTFDGREYTPGKGYWKTGEIGFERLIAARRIESTDTSIYYVRYVDDFPAFPINNLWSDTVVAGFASDKRYVVETSTKVLARCILMATDPGDLVLDLTCGSGTTAVVAEQWGRRWITCDTSRVAVALTKERLLTSTFDYYRLAHPNEGIGSGFVYEVIPHVMLKSIANNPALRNGMSRAEIKAVVEKHADKEILYDQPEIDSSRWRVTGPFTVESVPAPVVRPLAQLETASEAADMTIGREGESLRQAEWRQELLKCGIRGKSGQHIHLLNAEPLAGARWLHVVGETKDERRERIVVSFGPEHHPLEQRQVAKAIEEAQLLVPKPKIVVFASFHFDPEAAKDVDEMNWPGVTLLKVQMNTDLLTEDLKKKRASNESFWMIGQPDIEVREVSDGKDAGKWQVEVLGFDYYNPRNGAIESGDTGKIAMWMLDTDYDGRSLYPQQVFFPMAGSSDGWAKLAKTLKAEIDTDLIEAYRGTVSLPFELGEERRIGVKIVDDRGIESLRIVEV